MLAAIEEGLPLVSRPYAALGRHLAMSENEVIGTLARLIEGGVIARFGVIVRHRELGYRANAMVAWDVRDEDAGAAGRRLASLPGIALCYRRERRPPVWPYNLFCMIFGRGRHAVLSAVDEATSAAGLDGLPRVVLLSGRRFTQRAARYHARGLGEGGSERWMPSTVA